MATLTEYDGSMDDTYNLGTSQSQAQSFKIAASSVITWFAFRGSKWISPSWTTWKAEIIEWWANPWAGTVVKEETFNSSALPVYTESPTFQSFTFATPTSTLTWWTTVYYLRITALNWSANDDIRWSADNTSPSYTDWSLWNWNTEVNTKDHNFKIFGTTWWVAFIPKIIQF